MVACLTDAPVPRGEHVPTADQRVVLWNQTWESYEMLLALRGERPRPLMAYLDGAIELMATSRSHELIKSGVHDIVVWHCLDRGIPYLSIGNYTVRQRMAEAGVEPDDCFVFGENPRDRHPPDLVLEVVWTSGGLDKLEIYKRLRVREVWFWQDDVISVHVLDAGQYERRQRSVWLPELDPEVVCEALQLSTGNEMIARMRAGR